MDLCGPPLKPSFSLGRLLIIIGYIFFVHYHRKFRPSKNPVTNTKSRSSILVSVNTVDQRLWTIYNVEVRRQWPNDLSIDPSKAVIRDNSCDYDSHRVFRRSKFAMVMDKKYIPDDNQQSTQRKTRLEWGSTEVHRTAVLEALF